MPPPYLLRSNLGGREGKGGEPRRHPLPSGWIWEGGRGGEPAVAAAAGLPPPAGSRKEGERKGSEGSVASAAACGGGHHRRSPPLAGSGRRATAIVAPLLQSDLRAGREGGEVSHPEIHKLE